MFVFKLFIALDIFYKILFDHFIVFDPSGFMFSQINKLTIKIYSNLSNINIRYYLKLRKAIIHRQFLKILRQNPYYVHLIVMIEIILFILQFAKG